VLEDVGTSTLKCPHDLARVGDTRSKWSESLPSNPPSPVHVQSGLPGRCPGEDGGPQGYTEFVEAIGDPKHGRHAQFKQRICGDGNPVCRGYRMADRMGSSAV